MCEPIQEPKILGLTLHCQSLAYCTTRNRDIHRHDDSILDLWGKHHGEDAAQRAERTKKLLSGDLSSLILSVPFTHFTLRQRLEVAITGTESAKDLLCPIGEAGVDKKSITILFDMDGIPITLQWEQSIPITHKPKLDLTGKRGVARPTLLN